MKRSGEYAGGKLSKGLGIRLRFNRILHNGGVLEKKNELKVLTL